MATRSPPSKPAAACTDMSEVRVEIDRLDGEIVALLAKRSGYVARAAELKKNRAAIVDEGRIAQIIARVRAQAVSNDADAELMEAIYRAMIAAFIAYEERAFDGRKG